MTPKVFGIAANTITITDSNSQEITGISGVVLKSFHIKASGDKKVLPGNNAGQKPVDIRNTNVRETATLVVEFESCVDPGDLMNNTTCAFTATSDVKGTETAGQAGVTGMITDAEEAGEIGNWWTYTITVEKVE